MKYFQKLIVLILGLLFCSVIVQAERMKISPNNLMNENKVVKNSAALNAITEDNFGDNKLLLIYGKSDRDISCKETMAKNLEHMKVDFDCIEVEKLNTKNIEDFKDVILIVTDINNRISDDIYKIFDYVNKGGNLLWAGMPEDISETFNSVYRKLGIKEMSGYSHIEGLHFFEEVVPGIKDRTFIDESVFKDSCINVRLDSSCKIIIESAGTEEKTPILWQRDYGKGKCIFYNGTSLGEKSYCGIFAGSIALLNDNFMYPIINAKVVFIDDFPAPQYDSTSNIIEKYYNRTIKEFYRDVWWPDMNSAAKKNNVLYTGLFVATYNSIVNPDEFVLENDSMEKYYGNSLLKNNYEIGLHGYNHQPLVGEGYLTSEDGENYIPWQSQSDMEASIRELYNYAKDMFPNSKFTSYVPPSNYLSESGRKALKNVLPDLKVISGVYNGPNKKEYIQDFDKADDGIVDFPRITSGMFNDDDTSFAYVNGLGLYGVFSHFIHPDDILDEERGRGCKWETLIEGLNSILSDVNSNYKVIRPLTVSAAADAVEIYEKLKVKLRYYDDHIDGQCDNFSGEAYFYLKTDKKPVAADDKCEVSKVGENSDKYYLVKAKSPEFKIELR